MSVDAATDSIELGGSILAAHDEIAGRLRAKFTATGTQVVNLVSSPGTGKTELLTHVLAAALDRGLRAGALVGDCATDNDARRLAASGAPVHQIVTEGLCHLEAGMIEEALDAWPNAQHGFDVLFIENVGNLVCPSTFDLGESTRVVLLSVTEGEDKPLKYPQIFHSADIAVITKIDLAEPCEFDRAEALANIEAVHPGMAVIETSARRNETVEEFLDHLLATGVAAP